MTTRLSWVSAAAIRFMLGCMPCHMPAQSLPLASLISPLTVMINALPCAGQLEPGTSSLSVESGLFRSLAFPYAAPHTDFLLLRTPVSRGGACCVLCFLPAWSSCRVQCAGAVGLLSRCNCSLSNSHVVVFLPLPHAGWDDAAAGAERHGCCGAGASHDKGAWAHSARNQVRGLSQPASALPCCARHDCWTSSYYATSL